MNRCIDSTIRVGISPGQMFYTAGAVRANQARNVRCPDCGRMFASVRIAHSDHGIPSAPQAVIPKHKSVQQVTKDTF